MHVQLRPRHQDPGRQGRIVEDRSLIKPDRNNFGPRLGFAYTMTPKTVIRGGYGISYIHFHRAGGANILPINGPQVDHRRRLADANPTPALPHDPAGLPRRL